MFSRLVAQVRQQWMGALALFLVLTGGAAYAANTVSSSDIVDNQVFSADVRNDTLAGGGLTAVDLRSDAVGPAEILNGGVRSLDVQDESLTAADIHNESLNSADVKDESLGGPDIINQSLTGADIAD